jgi:hypothetical protein
MKKIIFSIFVATLLMGGIAFAGSAEILGQGGYPSDAHKIYRFVHNAGAVELAENAIVVWDTTMDNGVSVTTTKISGDSTVAGILTEAIPGQATAANTAALDIGLANWGLMQTYGLAEVNVATGNTPIAGEAFGCSTTLGEAATYAIHGGGATAIQIGKAGFYYDDAVSGEDDVEVFLMLD